MTQTTRKPLTRLEILVVIAIVVLAAVLIVGILDLYDRYFGHSTSEQASGEVRLRSSNTRAASPKTSPGFQSRKLIDTSGFAPLAVSIRPWDSNDSLQKIAEAWIHPGTNALARLEPNLQSARQSGDPTKIFDGLLLRAMLLNSEGEPKRAYETLEEVRSLLKKNESLDKYGRYSVMYFQGVTALRRGENENCIECRGESSCIIPISAAAVHTNPTGSRLAIQHFTEFLEQFPGDLEVRWLLNLAHMTLGEYPEKVNPKYLISLDRFTHSEFDIGKFRDIGHVLGVNRFNQAGGAIMDDFDGDGYLDLMLTSFDPTIPMAYYHNSRNGTFEDRTEQAGLTDQLGGLVCYQTDYNNDGLLDVFVARGAWLPIGIRPSLLRNDGGGKFTDVTKEAGMLEPVNSNSACWADFDNDGWLDVFIGCERQPHLLYHNRKDGTFEEVAAKTGLQANSRSKYCKGATCVDFDNDGYPDLFLNNLAGVGELYRNNRDGTFKNVSSQMGIDGPYHGFSCWAWDYDNDGWQDIFATCYDRTVDDVVRGLVGQPHAQSSNRLFRNLGGTGFENKTKEAGLDLVLASMGSNYADFDNDGFMDMYMGTGEPSFAMLIPNRMFKNVAGSRFSEITGSSGTGHLQKGHGVACGDWDRDGDIDLFVETGGAVNGDRFHDVLFQNPGQGNHWLTVKLVGKKTNRAAIGARIKVVTSDAKPMTIHRHVSSGSSFGANPLQQTIGLAQSKHVAVLEIHWPTSGTTQVFRDIPADQAIEVTEFADSFRRLDWKAVPQPE
jgi:FG-GAP-like repeat/ASPIC and UnbV